nr:transposon protein, putative, CACTA, En/Spm sub-class [Oryza sativa Japonica Group]
MAMIIRSRKRTRGSRREDTIHMCIEEQVAMFLHTVGHNLRNRLVRTNYDRSGETDCIGAIDGTHIRASVRKNMESSFRGKKSHATQNVMAAVDFDLRFTYVLAGWEGTAHDEENDGPATTDDRAEASSASKPKKAKTQENEDDGLIGAFTSVGDKLASAILKVAEPDNKLLEGLFDTLKTLPGFEEVHRSFYYAHLVANPHIARAFNGLPFENKMHWFAMFISEKFPGST